MQVQFRCVLTNDKSKIQAEKSHHANGRCTATEPSDDDPVQGVELVANGAHRVFQVLARFLVVLACDVTLRVVSVYILRENIFSF